MPRAGLTPGKVVAEAAALADEVGLDRLTLAEVAARLGVRLPSLYKHVDGLDGLRRSLAVLATQQLGDAMAGAALGRARGDALHGIAHAYRRYATEHPGRYAATLRAPDPGDEAHVAASDHVLRVVAAVLEGYGLAGETVVDAARTLRAVLHGFVTLEAAGGFGLPRDVERSFAFAVAAVETALSS